MRWCSRYWPRWAWSHFHLIAGDCSQLSPLSQLSSLTTPQPGSWVWLAPSRRVTGCILPTTHLLQWATFSVTQALNSFGWTVQSQVFCEKPRIPLTGLLFFVCKDFLFVYDLFISHLIPQRELGSPPTRVSANRPTIIGLAHLDVQHI